MQSNSLSSRSRLPWLLLLLLSPIWTLWLVLAYGVDIPYWDLWEQTCPLFQKLHSGTLGLADFLRFQNEHRVLFPRLIAFGLGLVTHWNLRFEMIVTWALGCVAVASLWRLVRVTGFAESRRGPWLLAALSFLMFTPVQYETWLLGISAFQIPMICLITCLWIPCALRPATAFLSVMALATVSTFSLATGFLVWVLAAPLLWIATAEGGWRRYRGWWALMCSIFLLELAVYFHGYQKPAHHPSPFTFIHEPVTAFSYAMAYLGADFAPDTFNATYVGTFLSALFLACIVMLWKHREDRRLLQRALPWLMLPCFAMANAILTTAGRLGFGVAQALATRYISFSIMLPVGLLFLVPLLLIDLPQERVLGLLRPARIWAMGMCGLALACLQVAESVHVQKDWAVNHRSRLSEKAALTFINVMPDVPVLSELSYDDFPQLKLQADALNQINYLRPKLVQSTSIAEVADPAAPGAARYGSLKLSRNIGSGVWEAMGSAALPGTTRPADAVLLTVNNGRNQPAIFTFAKLGGPRGLESQDAAENTAWFERFDQKSLPADAASIKAWAYDAESGRAYRIQGEIALRP